MALLKKILRKKKEDLFLYLINKNKSSFIGGIMEIEEIKNGIEDWFAIIDYDDKEQSSWCRRNITALKKQIRKIKKERGNN